MLDAMDGPKRSFEGSCRSTASPEQVWALWTDPSVWPGGPIATAKLHGAFEVGGKITTRVRGYPAGTSTITRIESPRLWIGVAKTPGLTMTYEHVIEPAAAGSVLTERAIITGRLAAVVARLIGRRLESTLAATTAHAAAVAEARAAAP
jgi:Polyketide cyclase / dehydrase and lipid transport